MSSKFQQYTTVSTEVHTQIQRNTYSLWVQAAICIYIGNISLIINYYKIATINNYTLIYVHQFESKARVASKLWTEGSSSWHFDFKGLHQLNDWQMSWTWIFCCIVCSKPPIILYSITFDIIDNLTNSERTNFYAYFEFSLYSLIHKYTLVSYRAYI